MVKICYRGACKSYNRIYIGIDKINVLDCGYKKYIELVLSKVIFFSRTNYFGM